MPSSESESRPPAPSLRSLAALAGVSSMTVSLALRDHPSISAATRARLKRLAADQGYRPDPVVAKLMQHLRMRRPQRSAASLCGLRLRPRAITAQGYDYGQLVTDAARRRAESLGFRFEEMYVDGSAQTARRLQRILTSRGVEGIVLLPMAQPVELERLLDWSVFSTVAATSSVLSPRLHTVIPDQFGNMMQLCRGLAKLGLRRIGLVTMDEQDLRVEHRFVAALGWHNTLDGQPPIPPLITRRGALDADALLAWAREHQLEVVVSDSEFDLDLIKAALPAKVRRSLTFVSTSIHPPFARYGGINERAEEVAAAAIEVVAAMLQRGERGLPASPRATLIAGEFAPPPRQGATGVGARPNISRR